MEIDKRIMDDMYSKIKDNMFMILENSIKDGNRAVKITEKTKRLRPEYVENNSKRKKQLVAVIENIRGMQISNDIEERQKEYILKMEDLVPKAIGDIATEEWISKKKSSVNSKDCEKILERLKTAKKVIEVERICEYIENRLFFEGIVNNTEYQRFYFINAINFNDKKEENHEEVIFCHEEVIFCKPIFIAPLDFEVSSVKRGMEFYEKEWIRYYKKYGVECLLNPEEYIHYILLDAQDGGIEKYIEGFMYATMIRQFGIAGGYAWAIENWGKIFVNYIKSEVVNPENETNVKLKKIFYKLESEINYSGFDLSERETRIIQRTVFSEKVMKQWLLFALLDNLISDDISVGEKNPGNVHEINEHCATLLRRIKRNEKAILDGSRILNIVTNKQVRVGSNDNKINEYYLVYKPQKECLEYLLSSRKNEKKRIFSFGKYQSPRDNQDFRSMCRHFKEIHSFQKGQKENYRNDFYLNQFIHLDSAVEIFYGISKMVKITQKTAKNLEREIVYLSNMIVLAQRKIRCGMGKILHECFGFYNYSEIQKYTEKECGEVLMQLAEKLRKIIFDLHIEEIENDLKKNILESNWQKIDASIDSERAYEVVRLDFKEDYIATITATMKNSVEPCERKNASDKIRSGLYYNSINGIEVMVRNLMAGQIQEKLQISQEAWEYTVDCFPELHGASGRDKDSLLYKEIQHALINANYK